MEPSPDIDQDALERLLLVVQSNPDPQQILALIQYRREIAAVAYQTGYKAHRQLFKDVTRRIKTILAL